MVKYNIRRVLHQAFKDDKPCIAGMGKSSRAEKGDVRWTLDGVVIATFEFIL